MVHHHRPIANSHRSGMLVFSLLSLRNSWQNIKIHSKKLVLATSQPVCVLWMPQISTRAIWKDSASCSRQTVSSEFATPLGVQANSPVCQPCMQRIRRHWWVLENSNHTPRRVKRKGLHKVLTLYNCIRFPVNPANPTWITQGMNWKYRLTISDRCPLKTSFLT